MKNNRDTSWQYESYGDPNHHPLSDYTNMLYKHGLVIEKIEEWTSDKESERLVYDH